MTRDRECVREWHQTDIIDIQPGVIRIRGYAIEDLIGSITFPSMIWLMLRGELPSTAQVSLFEAVLVSAVDHGPQSPSIAIARMAATCGVGINSAIASGVNVLGDVHGGAGSQCMELLLSLDQHDSEAGTSASGIGEAVALWQAEHGRFIPGFGHRFHPVDPRATKLAEMVDHASDSGLVDGRYLKLARKLETLLRSKDGAPIPINIDGATAVVLLELGFEPGLGRSVFVLSRTVGICAHAWEQTRQGGRIKGPIPPEFGFAYNGRPHRVLEKSGGRSKDVP